MGAKTSGSGECPFSDVRSPSTAPLVPPQLPRARGLRERVPDALHILRCAAPVRPHLPITAQLARVHRSRGPRGPHTCWGPRPNGPSTSLGSLRARRREPPGLRGPFCLEPVLRAKPVPSAVRVSLHRRGRFVFTSVNKICS